MLEHGGCLREAVARSPIPLQDWIDLSTGINPNPWPVGELPASAWARLPEKKDPLDQAARQYFRCQQCLAVAGSQAAIQTLPRLKKKSRIGMLQPAYAEHAHAWQQSGHDVIILDPSQITDSLTGIDHLLLINPNNPTGQHFAVTELLGWHQVLRDKAGWLIVDEAFIDTTPQHSLAGYSHLSGLIVLRSLGKFFGLAGARVGFVLAESKLLEALAELLGPWSVSGPSRFVATQALSDTSWQLKTRQQLTQQGQRLHTLLTQHKLSPTGGCSLFQWITHPDSARLADYFRQHGILLREFDQPASLRFGLPANEAQWQRLEKALQQHPLS